MFPVLIRINKAVICDFFKIAFTSELLCQKSVALNVITNSQPPPKKKRFR